MATKEKSESAQQLSLYDETVLTQTAFNKEVFRFGLELIGSYRNGTCRDANATLGAIIEIFKAQPKQN